MTCSKSHGQETEDASYSSTMQVLRNWLSVGQIIDFDCDGRRNASAFIYKESSARLLIVRSQGTKRRHLDSLLCRSWKTGFGTTDAKLFMIPNAEEGGSLFLHFYRLFVFFLGRLVAEPTEDESTLCAGLLSLMNKCSDKVQRTHQIDVYGRRQQTPLAVIFSKISQNTALEETSAPHTTTPSSSILAAKYFQHSGGQVVQDHSLMTSSTKRSKQVSQDVLGRLEAGLNQDLHIESNCSDEHYQIGNKSLDRLMWRKIRSYRTLSFVGSIRG